MTSEFENTRTAPILLGRPVPYIFMTVDTLTVDRFDPGVTTLRNPFQDHDLARAIEIAFATEPPI